MTIETTLYSALSGDAGVTALVSSKIYPVIAPDSAAAPYITYQLVATESHNLTNGAPATERKVFQINCFSNTYSEAKSIAEAVKSALNSTVGYMTGEGDDYFPSVEIHRVRVDFSLIG